MHGVMESGIRLKIRTLLLRHMYLSGQKGFFAVVAELIMVS
jgi:hypothetical protein